jgi:hypothetical protein
MSASRDTPRRIGLFPGSPKPEKPAEVDALLRVVPAFVFAPELETCLFDKGTLLVRAGERPFQRLERLADATHVARVRACLGAVIVRAQAVNDGGLLFLATALGHFLGVVPNAEHPLLVALYCRSMCRLFEEEESPSSIAEAMDDYGADLPGPAER